MTIRHSPYRSRFQDPGFYFNIQFMHGDADVFTYSKYFIPVTAGKQAIANFLYMLKNLETDGTTQDEVIMQLAPTYVKGEGLEWPYDCTGYDGRARPWYNIEILYWDGTKLLNSDVEWNNNDIPDDVKAIVKSYDPNGRWDEE